MAIWRQHPAGRNPLVSQVLVQRFPSVNPSFLAPCEILDLPNPWCRIRQSSWLDSCLEACGRLSTTRLFLHRRYLSEDSSIHCLKQSGIAARAASRISQLGAEMLAAPNDDNDPFLTSDDNENERNDCRRYRLTSSTGLAEAKKHWSDSLINIHYNDLPDHIFWVVVVVKWIPYKWKYWPLIKFGGRGLNRQII